MNREKLNMNKKNKIAFILSSRNDFDKSNTEMYKDLYNEYLKMESTELDIEFNFYYNNGGQQQ
jgi:hypothetical protein|tara:strand:+ start:466 stop:654 length:189 start_codon:yes stop_codon:yes gene_type:complete